MTTDSYKLRKTHFWNDESDEVDELSLPKQPEFLRCTVVRCIQHGPWAGTLVSCVRKAGHQGDHLITRGDVGTRLLAGGVALSDFGLGHWFRSGVEPLRVPRVVAMADTQRRKACYRVGFVDCQPRAPSLGSQVGIPVLRTRG